MTEALTILWPALLAGLLVLVSHVPLGTQVLKRGIIFIDLAVAQAAATGALVASLVLEHSEGWPTQAAAGSAALAMAVILHQLEKWLADIQEALIGGTFVMLACIAVLVSSQDSHGSEHISNLLAGQILWVDPTMLWSLAIASTIAVVAARLFRHPLAGFYLPFALAITAAVQAIGVYLVFATLIFPALGTLHLRGRWAPGLAMLCGIVGYAAGLMASLWLDLPSGPAIVVALGLMTLPGLAHRAFFHRPQPEAE